MNEGDFSTKKLGSLFPKFPNIEHTLHSEVGAKAPTSL